MTDQPAAIVDNVSKKFRIYKEHNQTLKSAVMRGKKSVHEDFWAIKDVSLEVPAGVTYALIGRNGSGKSTLLKCLARILYPDKGSITYNGRQASLLEVGSGFHPELTGRENIFLNGSILGMSKKEITKKFDEIVDFSEVGEFIDQPVKTYSSGMYVRLGFSVAINVDPDILVLDEVLAVGDAAFRAKCFDKFADFQRDGKTIIMVTHSMGTVRKMCDQAAWLHKGELRMTGNAREVADAYEDFLPNAKRRKKPAA